MITRIQRAAKAPLKVARRHQGAVEFCLLEADVAQLVEQRIRNFSRQSLDLHSMQGVLF